MKKLLLIFALLNSVQSFALECENKDVNVETDIVLALQETPKVENMSSLKFIQSDERRGCCSWHGGVCGCSNGRALCCDNTLSPSCGCN